MRRAPKREGFWHRDHVIALLEGNERGKRIKEQNRIEERRIGGQYSIRVVLSAVTPAIEYN